MRRIALIGGTGAAALVPADARRRPARQAPYGAVSGEILEWQRQGTLVLYLPRHGAAGNIPPHRVNYRANIWALHELRPEAVIGLNAVGGITQAARPGRVVIPDQLIDYTSGRDHTFFDGDSGGLTHVEFDPPFTAAVREQLLKAAAGAELDVMARGTYGVTQGPRLETAAEIDRMALDGCDVVGMTAMPEAALARELDLPYAICAVVVNRAAGRLAAGASIPASVRQHVERGMEDIRRLLECMNGG